MRILALALALFIAGPAIAADEPEEKFELRRVAEIVAGATFSDDNRVHDRMSGDLSFKEGFVLGAAFGVQIQEWIRSTVSYDFRRARADTWNPHGDSSTSAYGQMQLHTFLFNVDLDAPIRIDDKKLPIVPYVGAGFGVSYVVPDFRIPREGLDQTDVGIAVAWQVRGGVAYEVNEKIAVKLGYRYFGTDVDIEFDNKTTAPESTVDYRSHEAVVGVRYSF